MKKNGFLKLTYEWEIKIVTFFSKLKLSTPPQQKKYTFRRQNNISGVEIFIVGIKIE